MYINCKGFHRKLFLFILLAICFHTSVVAAEPQSADGVNKEDAAKVDREHKAPDTKPKKEAENSGALMHVPIQTLQYCQGKYEKKGIGGIEIISVKCPEVTSTCSCEVTKKNLRERVNCGGSIKTPSKGSNLISCDSQIVGN